MEFQRKSKDIDFICKAFEGVRESYRRINKGKEISDWDDANGWFFNLQMKQWGIQRNITDSKNKFWVSQGKWREESKDKKRINRNEQMENQPIEDWKVDFQMASKKLRKMGSFNQQSKNESLANSKYIEKDGDMYRSGNPFQI